MNAISPGAISRGDLSEAVRSTAMLADVTLAVWGAERTDKKIMEDAKAQAGAVGNVGRAIKNMLAGADGGLRDTKAAFAAVRAQHYALTLPWVSDPHAERQRGPRLLPNMLFDKYMSLMSAKKRAATQALDKFIADYPDAVVRARANLGGLADANYPSPEEVRAQFRISFDFEPIPAGTDFRGLPPDMLERLGVALARKQEVMLEGAQAAMWAEVRERIGRIAERLADKDAQFKEGTVRGVRELVELLPGWNVTGDPRAAEIAADISRMMGDADAAALRKDAALREDVASQAGAVVDKLKAWGL